MSLRLSARAAALVAALPVLCGSAASQSSAHLSHTAPFLGQTLTIRIEGAPSSAAIDLLLSPSAGTYATPYGNLELARSGLHYAAHGTTSMTGDWSVDFPIPLDASLAETERHYQAIVDDPSAPAGRTLSDAVHLRLLGSRMYAGHAGGIEIYSAVSETVVARVEFAGGFDSKPVFDPSSSRGAVMSSARELLFFDPYFGGIQATIPFASDCSGTLIQDSDRATVYVLETGAGAAARIHAIELSSGTETSHLDLPNPTAGIWCEGSAGVEAFVAEFELDGRTAMRRVALDPLADLGSAILGDSGNHLEMIYAAGQVFVSTIEPATPPPNVNGCLIRCRVVGSSILTSRTTLPWTRMFSLTAVPEADRILLQGLQVIFPYPPGFMMLQVPLSKRGPIAGLPYGTWRPEFARFLRADGPTAWIIGELEFGEGDYLTRMDFVTGTWERYGYWPGWGFDKPAAAELVRDPLAHALWIANTPQPPPVSIRPKITVVDDLHSTSRRLALDHPVTSLHAVPVP